MIPIGKQMMDIDKHVIHSNKTPFEIPFKGEKQLKEFIRSKAKESKVVEKFTNLIRIIKFEDGTTYYYVKKRKK